MQKYTNGILHTHINTLHDLHRHYVSSFRTDFPQPDIEVEIEKKPKGKVFN